MARTYDKDPYAILGVPSTATSSQIRQAYHRLARQYHPDLNKDPRASERMKDINWANDILSDSAERAQYDFWRSARNQTTYYPGSGTSYSNPAPAPRGSYSPPPRPTYSSPPVARSPVGCAPGILIWFLMMILLNVLRSLGSTSSGVNLSATYFATQTAHMETLVSSIETFRSSQGLETGNGTATLLPLFQTLVGPSATPQPTILTDEPGHEDIRSRVIPGSWEWKQIYSYFPELTTADGLVDEVTLVTFDQLQGYHIQTRTLGDYWLHVDPASHAVSPTHYPPTVTVTPSP